jgi:hypothetical protein
MCLFGLVVVLGVFLAAYLLYSKVADGSLYIWMIVLVVGLGILVLGFCVVSCLRLSLYQNELQSAASLDVKVL